MLRAIDPLTAPADSAYGVPWEVDRTRAPWYRLGNCGDEPLHGVRITMLDDGALIAPSVTRLEPGERLSFVVRDENPAVSSIAVVRWFRPDESEYIWQLSF